MCKSFCSCDVFFSFFPLTVCYDDDLTDALFRTLYRISGNLRHSSTAYISLEKR